MCSIFTKTTILLYNCKRTVCTKFSSKKYDYEHVTLTLTLTLNGYQRSKCFNAYCSIKHYDCDTQGRKQGGLGGRNPPPPLILDGELNTCQPPLLLRSFLF